MVGSGGAWGGGGSSRTGEKGYQHTIMPFQLQVARLLTTWPLCSNDNTTKASAPLIKASQQLQIQFNSLLHWQPWYHYATRRHSDNHCLSWEKDEKDRQKKKRTGKIEWWWGGWNLQLGVPIRMSRSTLSARAHTRSALPPLFIYHGYQ